MESLTRITLFAVLATLIGALAPLAAHADIFAAVNVAAPPPRTDFDVAIVNASLGTRVALPAGVNTTAFEVHPSISADGRRLVFRRFGGRDGQRVVLVDVTTGQSADLFTSTQIASNTVFNSTISRDGRFVYTGRRFVQSGSSFVAMATRTDVSSFPIGPFPQAPLLGNRFDATGIVTDVSVEVVRRSIAGGGLQLDLPYHLMRVLTGSEPGNLGKLVYYNAESSSYSLRSNTRIDYGYPRLSFQPRLSPHPLPLFEQRTYEPTSNAFGSSDVVFATDPGDPPVYRTAADESQPAAVAKPNAAPEEYHAFVRHEADGRDRLFVRDTETSTLLNPNGVDLGLVATRGIGAVSLYLKTVIASSQITLSGQVNATLLEPTRIGILVQRILGVTKDRGVKQYELERVGRVPLGDYGAGKVFTQWDFAVDGEPLPPGRYLVTLRALEGDLVRELGRSRVIHIRR